MIANLDRLDQPRPELKAIHALLLDPTIPKVFDFDDTIGSTSRLQRQSVVMATGAMGLTIALTPEYGITHLRGKAGPEIMAIVLRDFGGITDPKLIAQALALRNKALVQLAEEIEDPISLLKPGVEDIVRLLRETGQKAAIVTQSPEAFVRKLLERITVDDISITDVFDSSLVIGETLIERADTRLRRDVSFAKPNPVSVNHAAHRILRKHDKALYVGDNDVDARTVAGREGIVGLIVNDDPAKRERLRREFYSYDNIFVLSSLEEVVEKEFA